MALLVATICQIYAVVVVGCMSFVHVTHDGAAVREHDVDVEMLFTPDGPTFLVVTVTSRAGLTAYVCCLLCVMRLCCMLCVVCCASDERLETMCEISS